jgi:hypothetical protein
MTTKKPPTTAKKDKAKPAPVKTQGLTHIYRLVDPLTGEARYVGKTVNPDRRLEQHIRGTRKGKMTPCKAWIASLAASGHRPLMEVIEVCEAKEWEERERFHISDYRAKFPNLKNLADGGNQPFCSKEVRRENASTLNKSKDAPINAVLRVLGKAKTNALKSGNEGRADYFGMVMSKVANSTGYARECFNEYGKKFASQAR